MDGNNRWSKKNLSSRYYSYRKGANNLIKLSSYLFEKTPAQIISAFALSINNMNRSSSILKMIEKVLVDTLSENKNKKLNFDIFFLGNFNFLNKDTKKLILKINQQNVYPKKLYIYLNYGGREDIKNAAIKFRSKKTNFNSLLMTQNMPDPEILIRTGGFNRISNFLLYQIAFTELFFLKKLWPDLNISDLKNILNKYSEIERKFGR